MSANLTIDPADPTPPYEQIRRQLAALVGSGQLQIGDRLPPVRQLAGDLGLAAGTVARAYRELEEAGLLTSRRGAGTRVAAAVRVPDHGFTELTDTYLARARALGVSDRDILAALRSQLS